jgi:hypothetical protein
MPQAPNSRIPLSRGIGGAGETFQPSQEHVEKKQGFSSPAQGHLSSEHSGVFPFSWGWQLAGLISALLMGLGLMVTSFYHGKAATPLLLLGMGLLGLSIYSAIRTGWLKEARTAPLPVKIGAGTVIICGLIPIAAALLAIGLVVVVLGALFAGR